jgi:hypothetical protein
MQDDSTLAALKKASQGLMMPSESEAPFEPFVWEGGDKLTPRAPAEAGQGRAGRGCKVGDDAEQDVYIVGRTRAGRWAGLKTTVVET